MPGTAFSYETVTNALRAGGSPVLELSGSGKVAIVPQAARAIALAFSADNENLFWTNPKLIDATLTCERPGQFRGPFGGDRLWLAPEFAYNRLKGKPGDPPKYQVPPEVDPGCYEIVVQEPDFIKFRLNATLRDNRDDQPASFELERCFMPAPPPFAADSSLMRQIDYAGFAVQHWIRADKCPPGKAVGLWHIMQLSHGTIILVPTRQRPEPTPYCGSGPDGRRINPDHLRWLIDGKSDAKIGLKSFQVTGRMGALRSLAGGRWALLVRQFPLLPGMAYCDGPDASTVGDEAVQIWDGYGFGEMEYHSPAVGSAPLPREYAETGLLWAFGGGARQIGRIARDLLGISIADLLKIKNE